MKYIGWIERWRWLLLGSIGLVCAFFAWQLLNLRLNPTPYFIDRSHPSRIADHQTKDHFTSTGETAIVVMQARQGNIYTPDYLQRLRELTTRINRISLVTEADAQKLRAVAHACCATRTDAVRADCCGQQIDALLEGGLDKNDLPALRELEKKLAAFDADAAESVAIIRTHIAPIARVRSLTTLEHLAERDDVVDVTQLVPFPLAPESLHRLSEHLRVDRLIRGLFVARDESASAILVELNIHEDDSITMIAMHDALAQIVAESSVAGPSIAGPSVAGTEADVFYLGGPPMITAQTSHVIQHDNFLLTPVVTIVMALILWWCYRRIAAVLIPLTIAGATTIVTLGTMAAFGIPLNIVTTVLPVFLISMVIADSVHVLNSYFTLRSSAGHTTALSLTFKELWYPMVFYSVTTMIGFIAMMNTDLTFLKQLGWFVLLGLSVGLFFNLVLLPTLLSVLRTLDAGSLDDNRIILWVGAQSEKLASWSMENKKFVLVVLGALSIISMGLATQIKSNNEVIGYFADDAPIRQHENMIRHLFGGTTPFSVVLSADKPDRFKDSDVVDALMKLQYEIDSTEHVTYSAGLPDYIANSYRILSNAKPDNVTPDAVAQHLFFYENARDRDIRDVVDLDYKNSRILVVANTDNTQNLRRIIDQVMAEARRLLPADIKVSVTGFAEILVTSAEEIVGDQIKNVSLALLVIWLAMLVLYRSPILAGIAIFPLTIGILFNLALMSLLKIPLNIGTALIATVTFGVGIDYAIHIMNFIRNALKAGEQLEAAILGAMRTLACGISINSLAVGLGCLVLAASQYQALQNLGILVASGMILCAATTLISLPVLASLAEPAWKNINGSQRSLPLSDS